MFDNITTQIAELMDDQAVVATVPQDGAAIVQWETKAGNARAAYTDRGAVAAPVAIRKAAAYGRTWTALQNGRYVGFAREAHAAMTKGHMAAFAALFPESMAQDDAAPEYVVVEGVKYKKAKPATDAVALPDRIDKKLFRSICEFVASPKVLRGKKGSKAEVEKGFIKSKQWISQMAAEWLEANPAD